MDDSPFCLLHGFCGSRTSTTTATTSSTSTETNIQTEYNTILFLALLGCLTFLLVAALSFLLIKSCRKGVPVDIESVQMEAVETGFSNPVAHQIKND